MRWPICARVWWVALLVSCDSSSVSKEVVESENSCTQSLMRQTIVGRVEVIRCDPVASRLGCTLVLALDSTEYSALRPPTCRYYTYDHVHHQLNILMPHIWMGDDGHGRIQLGYLVRKMAGDSSFEIVDTTGNVVRHGNPWGPGLPIED